MKAAGIDPIEIDMKELETLLERARAGPLSEEEHQKLKAAIATLGYLVDLIDEKGTTIQELRQLLFGRTTEKTRTGARGRRRETATIRPGATGGRVVAEAETEGARAQRRGCIPGR